MHTFPNDMPAHPDPASLSRLKDAIKESKTGQRQDLFAARDALSVLASEIESGPNEPLRQVVEVIQKILGSLLRGSSFDEETSVLDLAEMLVDYLATAMSNTPSAGTRPVSWGAGAGIPLTLGSPSDMRVIERMTENDQSEGTEGEDSLKLINDSRLGVTLVRLGHINTEQLDQALVLQGVGCKRLGEVLLGMGVIDSSTLQDALTEQRAVTLRLADGLTAGKLQLDKTDFHRHP